MFMNNLTSYCHPPLTKIANYTIENIKGDMSLARPLKKWSNINDRSKPPSPVFRRKIRSEDINVRHRSLDEDVRGRLTDFESEEYMRQINEDAKKFALIGEKVITDLFKVQVPDPSDKEYINKRSETMAQLKMSKEDADVYLKENFREQYTTKKAVDITRMDAPVNVMLDTFKQMDSKMERSPENVARMKNVLNNTLLKDGDRSVEDLQKILNILINKPFYRVAYNPQSPLRLLGMLSNIVVGNDELERDAGVGSKQVSPVFNTQIDDATLKALIDEISFQKEQVQLSIDEQKDNNVVASVDTVMNDEVNLDNFVQRDLSGDPPEELSEELKIKVPTNTIIKPNISFVVSNSEKDTSSPPEIVSK